MYPRDNIKNERVFEEGRGQKLDRGIALVRENGGEGVGELKTFIHNLESGY